MGEQDNDRQHAMSSVARSEATEVVVEFAHAVHGMFGWCVERLRKARVCGNMVKSGHLEDKTIFGDESVLQGLMDEDVDGAFDSLVGGDTTVGGGTDGYRSRVGRAVAASSLSGQAVTLIGQVTHALRARDPMDGADMAAWVTDRRTRGVTSWKQMVHVFGSSKKGTDKNGVRTGMDDAWQRKDVAEAVASHVGQSPQRVVAQRYMWCLLGMLPSKLWTGIDVGFAVHHVAAPLLGRNKIADAELAMRGASISTALSQGVTLFGTVMPNSSALSSSAAIARIKAGENDLHVPIRDVVSELAVVRYARLRRILCWYILVEAAEVISDLIALPACVHPALDLLSALLAGSGVRKARGSTVADWRIGEWLVVGVPLPRTASDGGRARKANVGVGKSIAQVGAQKRGRPLYGTVPDFSPSLSPFEAALVYESFDKCVLGELQGVSDHVHVTRSSILESLIGTIAGTTASSSVLVKALDIMLHVLMCHSSSMAILLEPAPGLEAQASIRACVSHLRRLMKLDARGSHGEDETFGNISMGITSGSGRLEMKPVEVARMREALYRASNLTGIFSRVEDRLALLRQESLRGYPQGDVMKSPQDIGGSGSVVLRSSREYRAAVRIQAWWRRRVAQMWVGSRVTASRLVQRWFRTWKLMSDGRRHRQRELESAMEVREEQRRDRVRARANQVIASLQQTDAQHLSEWVDERREWAAGVIQRTFRRWVQSRRRRLGAAIGSDADDPHDLFLTVREKKAADTIHRVMRRAAERKRKKADQAAQKAQEKAEMEKQRLRFKDGDGLPRTGTQSDGEIIDALLGNPGSVSVRQLRDALFKVKQRAYDAAPGKGPPSSRYTAASSLRQHSSGVFGTQRGLNRVGGAAGVEEHDTKARLRAASRYLVELVSGPDSSLLVSESEKTGAGEAGVFVAEGTEPIRVYGASDVIKRRRSAFDMRKDLMSRTRKAYEQAGFMLPDHDVMAPVAAVADSRHDAEPAAMRSVAESDAAKLPSVTDVSVDDVTKYFPYPAVDREKSALEIHDKLLALARAPWWKPLESRLLRAHRHDGDDEATRVGVELTTGGTDGTDGGPSVEGIVQEQVEKTSGSAGAGADDGSTRQGTVDGAASSVQFAEHMNRAVGGGMYSLGTLGMSGDLLTFEGCGIRRGKPGVRTKYV